MSGLARAGSGVEASPEVRRVLRRWAMRPSWLLAAALVLLFNAGLEVPAWVEYLPFALSLVLFGLPHGAVDHLAVPRLLGRKAWPGPVLAVGLLYFALGGAYLVLWFIVPVLAFALFVALTWFHWGAGDLYALLAFAPNGTGHLQTRTSRILNLLVRGGLPMLIPLLAFPETYRAVAGSLIGLFGSGSTGELSSWAFDPYLRLVAGVAFVLLTVGALASGYGSAKKAGARGAWGIDAAETALLALYFALVPSVFAVGLYFCLWHSVRHVARLVLLDEKTAATLATGRVAPALIRFTRDALPLTVAALFLLVWLYLATPGADVELPALLALYLVLISTLTFPHVVVVTWMDLRQGLWR